jgi:hypothetical protein
MMDYFVVELVLEKHVEGSQEKVLSSSATER